MNLRQEILDEIEAYGINSNYILECYSEEHRFYHTFSHIESIYTYMKNDGVVNAELFLTLIFHDIVYNPKRSDNEEKSAEVFINMCNHLEDDLKKRVVNNILDTATHIPRSESSKVFCMYDLKILVQPLCDLIKYENEIFLEYQFVDINTYRTKRVEVLENLSKNHNINLQHLIDYVKSRKYNIGVYAGSFNPLTLGHKNIFNKAEKIFNKVILLNGQNQDKEARERKEYKDFEFKEVVYLEFPLTTDYIKSIVFENVNVTLIRGLRNATDLQYEQNQLAFMKELYPELNVVYISCDKEFEHISSSAIKSLQKIAPDLAVKYTCT